MSFTSATVQSKAMIGSDTWYLCDDARPPLGRLPEFARDPTAASPRIGTRALAPGDNVYPDIVVPLRTSSQNTQSEMTSPVEPKSTLCPAGYDTGASLIAAHASLFRCVGRAIALLIVTKREEGRALPRLVTGQHTRERA